MIKLVGLMGIFLSLTLVGFSKAGDIQTRLSQLKTAHCMLEEIEIYLEYGVMTKYEIFEKVLSQEKYSFLTEQTICESKLDENEINHILSFYNQFGTTDLQGQLSYLKMTKEFITESVTQLKGDISNKCKLYRSSGILVGIFVCIILI